MEDVKGKTEDVIKLVKIPIFTHRVLAMEDVKGKTDDVIKLVKIPIFTHVPHRPENEYI
jgi:hypothetical protein